MCNHSHSHVQSLALTLALILALTLALIFTLTLTLILALTLALILALIFVLALTGSDSKVSFRPRLDCFQLRH